MKKIISKLKGFAFHTLLLLILLILHFSNKNYIINYPLVLYIVPLSFLLTIVAYKLHRGVKISRQIESNSFIFPISLGVLCIILFFEIPGKIMMRRHGAKEVISCNIERCSKGKGRIMNLKIYNDSIQENIQLGLDSSILDNPKNFEIEALCYKFYLNSYFVDDYSFVDIDQGENIPSPKDSSRYIFKGEIMKSMDGVHVPLDQSVVLEVHQNGSRSIDTLEGRDFSIELNKRQSATLVFISQGFKTKKLHLTKVPMNTTDIFEANCVFVIGQGTTEKTMNLDSLARAS